MLQVQSLLLSGVAESADGQQSRVTVGAALWTAVERLQSRLRRQFTGQSRIRGPDKVRSQPNSLRGGLSRHRAKPLTKTTPAVPRAQQHCTARSSVLLSLCTNVVHENHSPNVYNDKVQSQNKHVYTHCSPSLLSSYQSQTRTGSQCRSTDTSVRQHVSSVSYTQRGRVSPQPDHAARAGSVALHSTAQVSPRRPPRPNCRRSPAAPPPPPRRERHRPAPAAERQQQPRGVTQNGTGPQDWLPG